MNFSKIKIILENSDASHRERSQAVGHFITTSKGSFDNVSWNKGDVGHYSKPVKDRHGFNSIYVRFKGLKSPKLIPVSLFKKQFKKSSDQNKNPEKWKPADKGGSKVKFTPTKKPLSRKEYESKMKGKKGKIMENKNILDIINSAEQKNAAQFQSLVQDELSRRINDCIEATRQEVCSSMFDQRDEQKTEEAPVDQSETENE